MSCLCHFLIIHGRLGICCLTTSISDFSQADATIQSECRSEAEHIQDYMQQL
ncbi:hypothetical protein HPTD01_2459 [Halomonas sp. TD01]|nr:hypothetical protein HPTD01_2459 [Halomonas sp. TD01]